MPVIVDPDEPPAKCCKFCEEATHGVDGSVSWRLTLDQDLIDTLKGSFPSWFQTSSARPSFVSCQQSSSTTLYNNCGVSVSVGTNCDRTVPLLPLSASISPPSSIISWTSSSSAPLSNKSSSSSPSSLSSSTCAASLLAAFASPNKRSVEITSENSCNVLLKHISQGFFKHELQDSLLLCDTFADMSEDDHRLCINPSLLGSDDGTNSDLYDPRQSPPKAIVDSSPLQPAMHKNKESLKVKLMVRRPHSQLVEQGIIPTLKTSPAIHEQCKQLERAKTGDLLKAKIQQRPNREELERRHILEEDECHIDPSLAEKQRMLKKARLADQLNSQIQHRPGPLELIKKNILHTEKPIEKIVKEGLVSFKATSEGLLTRPQHPNSYITFEDDSQSSESDTRNTPPRSEDEVLLSFGTGNSAHDVSGVVATSAGIVKLELAMPPSNGQMLVASSPNISEQFQGTKKYGGNSINQSNIPPPPPPPPNSGKLIHVKQETANLFEELCKSVAGPNASPGFPLVSASPLSLGSSTSTLSPLSSIASPPQVPTPRPTIISPILPLQIVGNSQKTDAPGKDKNRKKCKNKPISKARTIKFHEYKGPPSAAQKMTAAETTAAEETSYQLMLEQQNCLLKFLEHLNKNQSIVPSASCHNHANFTSGGSRLGLGSLSSTATVTSPSNVLVSTMSFGDSTSCTSSQSSFTITSTPRPPPMPSPALSVTSSIPASPATSCTESTYSLSDITRLEKMKVSDLKLQLKRRNLPVSGPKPQLIERLKPYLPLDSMDCTPPITSKTILSSSADGGNDTIVDNQNSSKTAFGTKVLVSSPCQSMSPESTGLENMDVVHKVQSPRPVAMQTTNIPPKQGQMTTIITLSNEDLLREQQRKIDELQRQLQRSQEELLQIRQKQQTANFSINENMQPKTLTIVSKSNMTTSGDVKEPLQPKININSKPQQQLTQLQSQSQQQQHTITNPSPPMSQKMVVKQHLEAKIQKQREAAAAAAAATAAQTQAQSQAMAKAQAQAQVQMLPQRLPLGITIKAEEKQPLTNLEKINTSATTINTRSSSNVGLMWNEGNQTIFLVGLPDTLNPHISRTVNDINGRYCGNERFVNGHHRTTSLPSIVFPITTTTASSSTSSIQQPLVEPKPFLTQHKVHLLRQHQQLPIRQPEKLMQIVPHIQLDIKPQHLPPPPLYEEGTKQLPNNDLALKAKAKEEALTSSLQQQSASKRKHHDKSEKLTDVLDILIKQGELPESALDPLTPITPVSNNAIMTDISGNIIFTNSTMSASLVSTPVIQMDNVHSSTVTTTTTTGAFHLLNTPMPPTSALTSVPSDCLQQNNQVIENIEMTSPLEFSPHIDSETVSKTLDVFLNQQHTKTKPSRQSDTSSSPPGTLIDSNTTKQNHFDEFELLELMSQQLEMDIGVDESCHNFDSDSMRSPAVLQHQSSHLNGIHRDMNPSLQPSINELIQQQLMSSANNNKKSSIVGVGSTTLNDSGTICLTKKNNNQNHSITHNSYPLHDNHKESIANANKYTGRSSLISSVGSQCISTSTSNSDSANTFEGTSFTDLSSTSSNNNYTSTPMDVCDDFDNPLGSFSFTQLASDSNINTPPHNFGSSGGGSCALTLNSLAHSFHHSSPASQHEQMSICGGSGATCPSDGLIGNEDNFITNNLSPINQPILDLFNIDDYKMSWGEGDFAV